MPKPITEPTPPADTDGRYPFGRRGAIVGLIFSGVCLIAGICLLFIVPGAVSDGREFRAAPVCAPEDSHAGRAGEDCRWTIGAKVDHFRQDPTPKGGPRYWWYLVEQDGRRTHTRISGTPTELPGLHPGSHLKVTYWRGEIRYVDFGAERRYTREDPRDAFGPYLGSGLGLTTFGLGFALVLGWSRRICRTQPRPGAWQSVPPLGVCLLTVFGGAAAGFSGSVGAGLKAYGVVAAVTAVCCVVATLILRLRRRGDDTIAVAASVLTEEQHFQGVIRGEVPYAGKGGTLVVGPGHLASTVDPTGVSYRHEVAPTLVPGRVRRLYWTDPGARYMPRGTVVLECVDEGTPVFILTRTRKMPLVLGALNSRRTPTGSPA